MATMYPLFCSLLLAAVCSIVGTGDVFLAICVERIAYSDSMSAVVKLHGDKVIALQRDAGTSNSRTNNLNVAYEIFGNSRRRHLPYSQKFQATSFELLLRSKVTKSPSGLEDRKNILAIAAKELGVREATGNNDGKRVEEYLRYTHLGKGYAWCAAFVSWCYGQAGLSQPRNPWAPALFPKSRKYIFPQAGKALRYSLMNNEANKSRLGQYDAKNSLFALNRSEPLRFTPFFRSVLYGRSDVFLTLYSLRPFLYTIRTNNLNVTSVDIKSDLFGIYSTSARRINHVGLIKEVQGKYLLTIEGNSHDRVESRRRPLSTIYALANWIDE